MEYILLGLALAFNILIVLWKFRRGRQADAILDASLLTLVAYAFSGSTALLIIGTIASVFVSVYLIFNPVTFNVKS